jgi:SsrA-binding protein
VFDSFSVFQYHSQKICRMAERSHKVLVSNRKARHFYTILETLEAGIALTGTEIKSLRGGNANLQDSYAMIERAELWLHGMHIGPYEHGSISNHDPRRTRKLLVTRKELRKLKTRVQEKGLALIPLSVYIKGRFASRACDRPGKKIVRPPPGGRRARRKTGNRKTTEEELRSRHIFPP